MMREAVAARARQPGLVDPDLGAAGRVRAVRRQPRHRRRELGGVHRQATRKDILLIVAHSTHQQAMRIINDEMEPPTTELSPREREALMQLSLGHSRAAVADGAADLGEHAARLHRLGPAQARGAERDACGGAGAGAGHHRAGGGVA